MYSEDFTSFVNGTVYADGANIGRLTSVFNGGGTNKILAVSGNNVLYQKPAVATAPSETHASLVTSRFRTVGDIDYTVRVNTVSQIRTGSAPNAWETAWVIWNYTDNTHFYYFALKTNGYELGKADPAYPGSQRFLATGGSGYNLGQWYKVRITQISNVITVYVDDVLVVSFTDTEIPYCSGAIGTYNEDAETYADNFLLYGSPNAINNSLLFDGVNDYAMIPDYDGYSYVNNSGLTVSVWVRPDALSMPNQEGSGYVEFLNKTANAKNEWLFRMYCTGNSESRENRFSFYHFTATGGLGAGADIQSVVEPGQWVHLVGRMDTKYISLYRNGVFCQRVDWVAGGIPITPSGTTAPIRVGAGGDNSDTLESFLQGALSDICIYNRALSNAEILDLYHGIVTPQNLTGHFRCDEGSGTTLVDTSSVGNNGTITGATYELGQEDGRFNVYNNTPLKFNLNQTDALSKRRSISPLSKSLSLNGSTQYASIADASQTGLDVGTRDFMFGGWFKIADTTGIQTLFEKYQGSGYNGSANTNIGWEVIYRGDQATKGIALRLTDGTNTSITVTFTKNIQRIADGQWHHLTFILARSSTANIYIDGLECLNPNTITALPLSFDNTGAFRVGTRQDAAAGFLKALVSDVFFYDYGVNGLPTAPNIQKIIENIYFNQIYSTVGLVSRWTFDNTANDSFGANNLTLTGSPTYSTDVPNKARNVVS